MGFPMSIGQNVKVYRENSGIKIEDFAARIGLSVADCEGIEAGKRMLSSSEIQRICKVLNVSLEALLSKNPTPECAKKGDADEEGSILMPVAELQSLLGKMRE